MGQIVHFAFSGLLFEFVLSVATQQAFKTIFGIKSDDIPSGFPFNHARFEYPGISMQFVLAFFRIGIGDFGDKLFVRDLLEFNIRNEFFAHPEVDFEVAATAMAVLLVAGVLAGLAPGLRAAAVDPIVALRDN